MLALHGAADGLTAVVAELLADVVAPAGAVGHADAGGAPALLALLGSATLHLRERLLGGLLLCTRQLRGLHLLRLCAGAHLLKTEHGAAASEGRAFAHPALALARPSAMLALHGAADGLTAVVAELLADVVAPAGAVGHADAGGAPALLALVSKSTAAELNGAECTLFCATLALVTRLNRIQNIFRCRVSPARAEEAHHEYHKRGAQTGHGSSKSQISIRLVAS